MGCRKVCRNLATINAPAELGLFPADSEDFAEKKLATDYTNYHGLIFICVNLCNLPTGRQVSGRKKTKSG